MTIARPHPARSESVSTLFDVPGAGAGLRYRREEGGGRLLAIEADGRTYFEIGATGEMIFDGGFAVMREVRRPDGLEREVSSGREVWREHYLWDDRGRLVHIDGVDVERDEDGRTTACLPGGVDPAPSAHRWFYAYGAAGVSMIDGPFGRRHISGGADGRVHAWRQDGRVQRFRYDATGRRLDVAPLPARRCHRDPAGRVWSVSEPDGRVIATFLWDGFRCLGRIDGRPGDPLAAVFSLDPSATPVRVTTRGGVRRLPRDAFGEGLLGQRLVPGLYGAFIHQGLAHLPWRTLDPVCGAFCAPDPFDGSELDPRRGPEGAWEGPLPTEPEGVGSYVVCRNDPIGRADPTGAVSAGLVISDFTWSFQNNLIAFFGIDWWFNLFLSLFTGFQLGDFASSEGLSSSDHLGAFGVRRDGFVAWMTGGRAFTTQHIVWSGAAEFAVLEEGWVIDPTERFDPTLYGTLLLARPANDPPFVLRGSRTSGGGVGEAPNWSRHGGTAEPAAPGSFVPVFPSGGFHLDGGAIDARGGQACPLTELRSGDRAAVGTFERRATIRLPAGTARPAVGEEILLSEAGPDLLLTRVASSTQVDGGRGLIRLEDDAPAIGPNDVTLRRLDPIPASSELLGLAAGVPTGLSVIGATGDYRANDILQATAGGGEVTLARLDRLEARLPLDRALPGGFSDPIVLRRTAIAPMGPSVPRVGTNALDFSGASVPAVNSFGLIEGGGNAIPVRVVNNSDAANVQMDADLGATGAPGGNVTFRPITEEAEIGRRTGAAEGAAQVTYTPARSGAAPDGSAGQVVLHAFSAGADPVVRLVTGAPAYDAIVLDRALAGAAPWTVDRRVRLAGTTDVGSLTITPAASLVVEPADVVDDALALRLTRVTSAAGVPTAGTQALAGVTMNGPTATITAAPGAGTPFRDNPRPGQVVAIRQGATDTLAVLRSIRLTATFDRALDLAERDLAIVLMAEAGFTWTAERIDDREIVLRPEAVAIGGNQDVDFPRIAVGECVTVGWQDGLARTERYRVGAAAGTRLTLEGPTAIGAAATDITVQRLVPIDSTTGGALLGREGERVGASPSNRASFLVWSTSALPPSRLVGVVSAGETRPAVIDAANQDVLLTFGADTTLNGAADIHNLGIIETLHVGQFLREGNALLITDDTAGLTAATGDAIVVQPFVDSGLAAGNARLHAGSLRIPSEEDIEVTRRQALVDHELAHTVQYAQWGPLWFCYFPMMLLELPIEFATGADLPTYSEFAAGTVTHDGRLWRLQLESRDAITIQADDKVQIVQGTRVVEADVTRIEAGVIFLRREEAMPTGAVQVRRRNAHPAWDVVFSILQHFTHGGLMNGVIGPTWGGVIWLLSKGVYGIVRAIKGTGDLHPAEVQADGTELRLTTDAGRRAINADGRVIVRNGSVSVVRPVTHADGVLTLAQPVAFTGEVRVAPYDTHDPGSAFNWYSYHAGSVVDASNPFVISVPGHGGDFDVHDRVEFLYRDQSRRCFVLAKTGDELQLDDPVPIANGELSLRITNVGESDPMGNADTHFITDMGMGWMRYLFDPWGQLDLRIDTQETWARVLLRAVRYVLGTQNFSLLPFLGYVFYGRFFIAEHLAKIEQDASEKSGDLYTPLARLFGQIRKRDAYGEYDMLVGDIARYRFWQWGNRENLNVINRARQGAPGVHSDFDDIRIMPYLDAGGADVDPNGTARTDPAQAAPGRALCDRFTAKADNDPTASVTAPGAGGFQLAALGTVPETPTNMRHVTGYVAFCRDGRHRITVPNGTFRAAEIRELQEAERQTIFFNINALPVTARLAGQDVADGATVTLVHTQQAMIEVVVPGNAPSGARTFRTTVRRPDDGPVLRSRNLRRLLAQATNGTEPVEVSRYYAFRDGEYVDSSLQKFGTHLGGDIDVPVLRFNVDVTDAVPLRSAAEPTAATAASLAQGADGFLLIPTAVRVPPRVTQFDGRALQAADPQATVERIASPSDATRTFIGTDGAAYRLQFEAAPALGGTVAIVIETAVGTAGGVQSTLRTTFDLTP